MTNTSAVITAAFIHMVLRMTIFIEPNYRGCSRQTPTSSWFFLLSILEILWDTEFIPDRYKILPRWCIWLAELLTCVFLIEFGVIVIWCNLEKLMYRSLKRAIVTVAPKLDHSRGDILVELVTVISSILLFYYVSYGTDTIYQLKRRFGQASRKLKGKLFYVTKSESFNTLFKKASCALENTSVDVEDGLRAVYPRGVRRSQRLSSRSRKLSR